MIKNRYALYEGSIYKKAPDSAFTYVFCCSVRKFLLRSLSNVEIANALVHYQNQVTTLLSDPSCRLIKPLIIDYNLIEVLPSKTCFHIARKEFVVHKSMRKGVSPRAFVRYRYKEDRVPYPKPFVQGMYYVLTKFSKTEFD